MLLRVSKVAGFAALLVCALLAAAAGGGARADDGPSLEETRLYIEQHIATNEDRIYFIVRDQGHICVVQFTGELRSTQCLDLSQTSLDRVSNVGGSFISISCNYNPAQGNNNCVEREEQNGTYSVGDLTLHPSGVDAEHLEHAVVHLLTLLGVPAHGTSDPFQ
jgi:hypothetical protein